LLGAALASIALAPLSYIQPFGDRLEPSPVAPLAPATVALGIGLAATNVMSTMEHQAKRRLVFARVAWGAALLVSAVGVSACAAAVADPEWRVPVVRNGVGLAGLSLVGAVAFGSRLAWMPAFVIAAVTFAAGRDPHSGTAQSWALLLAPAESRPALTAAVTLGLVGLVVHAIRDSRPSQGVVGE
jgi:hypothetical protein